MNNRLMNPTLPKTMMLGDSHLSKLCPVVDHDACWFCPCPQLTLQYSLNVISYKAVLETLMSVLPSYPRARLATRVVSRAFCLAAGFPCSESTQFGALRANDRV